MVRIELQVDKSAVYDEVAKTTSWLGAKLTDADEGAYERIYTKDEDQEMLERFWSEACTAATGAFKHYLVEVGWSDGKYCVALDVASGFDSALKDTINAELFSFFVMLITGKWCKLAAKGEAESYAASAVATMEDMLRNIYWRKRPERP